VLATLSVLLTASGAYGQAPGPQATSASPAGAASPEQTAPIDLTGNWVSLVTVDWRWRMVTPARGDFQSVPLNQAAYDAAMKWDAAKDEAAGQQCKSYGAAALMAVPTRLRINWSDAGTLQVQTDAGMQTRLLHFAPWNPRPDAPASWQGESAAVWQISSTGPANPVGGANEVEQLAGSLTQNAPTGPAQQVRRTGSLKVVTTNLLPGYLRKNGIPYSTQTRLTEYWDVVREQNGTPELVITSIVHDPVYLQQDWITALHFEKEPDGSKWDPQPCSARW
jgi:hypothetical protein